MDKRIDKVDQHFKEQTTKQPLKYYNPKNSNLMKVYGLNWFDIDKRYERFPKSSDKIINSLSETLPLLVRQPSGGCIVFSSNTTTLAIKVKLGQMFNMAHMAYTGQGGVDLYIGDNVNSLTFYRTSTFYQKEYEFCFFEQLSIGTKIYVLNLPLYAQVFDIEIGLDEQSKVEPVNIFNEGRIVWYGTSITQGGCASRPGICPSNTIARQLGYEVLNFGFSGHGHGEKEVASIISQINNVDLFIVDYEANATFEILTNTLEPFLDMIRLNNPTTPILLISKIKMSREMLDDNSFFEQRKKRTFQRETIINKNKKDAKLFFLDGHRLIGSRDTEATVDGCHPNDYGFYLISKRLIPVIKKVMDPQ